VGVASFVVRIWLPDRPGSLGAVATRIGMIGGDLTGIDILERGAGRAIDELVVSLPDDAGADLLATAIGEVEGVDVEDVRPAQGVVLDPRLDALQTAALLVEHRTVEDLHGALVRCACHAFEAVWCAVIDVDGPVPLAVVGTPPSLPWLGAFISGSRSSVRVAAGECGPDDVAWALLADELVVVVGRHGRPFRARERHQLAALARIAGVRAKELGTWAGRGAHPSAARART